MSRLSMMTVAAFTAVLFGSAVHAQQPAVPASPPPPPPGYGEPITLEQANTILAAALTQSRKQGYKPMGIILSGGPSSVYDADAPPSDPVTFRQFATYAGHALGSDGGGRSDCHTRRVAPGARARRATRHRPVGIAGREPVVRGASGGGRSGAGRRASRVRAGVRTAR